jgi:hypothetical protein
MFTVWLFLVFGLTGTKLLFFVERIVELYVRLWVRNCKDTKNNQKNNENTKKFCNVQKISYLCSPFLNICIKKNINSSCQIQNGGSRRREHAKEEPTTN